LWYRNADLSDLPTVYEQLSTANDQLPYTLCSYHFLSDWLLATTLSINAIPLMPSSTEGKSSASLEGVVPSILADKVCAKFL
jgi:hypothetical protein